MARADDASGGAGAHPRGAVQRRAARAARREPRGRPARHRRSAPRARRSLPRARATTGACCSPSYRAIAEAIREERAITPAAEWLVDNFHIVDEQLREIRDDLPPGFYRELPKLADGLLAGLSARLRHRLGVRRAHRQPLRARGAAPLRARLPARAAAHDRRAVGGRDHAAHRAGREPAAARGAHRHGAARTRQRSRRARRRAARARRARRRPRRRPRWRRLEKRPLPRRFAVQLVQRLREQDPDVVPALRWLDERLAAQGTTADEIVRLEHQRQAAMNVTVRNVITSMRLMSALRLEGVLRERQPGRRGAARAAASFAAMDFADPRPLPPRDRGARARLAAAPRSRSRAAWWRARRRRRAPSDPGRARSAIPGYHLIAQRARGARARARLPSGPAAPARCARYVAAAHRRPTSATIALAERADPRAPARLAAARRRRATPWLRAVRRCSRSCRRPTSPSRSSNRGVIERIGPRAAAEARAARRRAGRAADAGRRARRCSPATAEVARADRAARGPLPRQPRRRAPLRAALGLDGRAGRDDAGRRARCSPRRRDGIAAPERAPRPGADGGARFFLFHRRAALERARGRLDGLGAQARQAARAQPPAARRDRHELPAVGGAAAARCRRASATSSRSTPTRGCPCGAARALVGTMAHPLNRPRFDPRVGPRRRGLRRPPAARHADAAGATARARSSSGSSSGPCGHRPVRRRRSPTSTRTSSARAPTPARASTTSTPSRRRSPGRVPENALLSHDLFEGIFARAGLVTDIEFFEEFPSHYEVAARAPAPLGARRLAAAAVDRRRGAAPSVPLLGRWKMLDNLRRTLSAPAGRPRAASPAGRSPVGSPAIVDDVRPRRDRARRRSLPVARASWCRAGAGISKRSHVRARRRRPGDAASRRWRSPSRCSPHQAWLMARRDRAHARPRST